MLDQRADAVIHTEVYGRFRHGQRLYRVTQHPRVIDEVIHGRCGVHGFSNWQAGCTERVALNEFDLIEPVLHNGQCEEAPEDIHTIDQHIVAMGNDFTPCRPSGIVERTVKHPEVDCLVVRQDKKPVPAVGDVILVCARFRQEQFRHLIGQSGVEVAHLGPQGCRTDDEQVGVRQ